MKSLTYLPSAASVATHCFSLVPPSQDQPLNPKGSLRLQRSALLSCSHPTSAAAAWWGCLLHTDFLCREPGSSGWSSGVTNPMNHAITRGWSPSGLLCGTEGNTPHQHITNTIARCYRGLKSTDKCEETYKQQHSYLKNSSETLTWSQDNLSLTPWVTERSGDRIILVEVCCCCSSPEFTSKLQNIDIYVPAVPEHPISSELGCFPVRDREGPTTQ